MYFCGWMNMADSWFFDKNFNGVPDDFFDDAIKYFDFPLEDVEVNEEEEDWEAKLQHLEPPPSNILAGLSSDVYGENSNALLKEKNQSSISHDESSRPSTGETSSRSIPLYYDSSEGKYLHQFRTSSPVSVLESSSSSCSAENLTHNLSRIFVPVKRPRSKRSRPQRQIFPFITSACTFKRFHPVAASESESESYIDERLLNSNKRRQKKRKNLMLLSCTVEVKKPSSQQPVETRKCTHCGVTKTPQWREGPMGPKTLCNACGVRYRSGRLLPEYRPAASPTFVPALHSNSHRKVLEMRNKAVQLTSGGAINASLPTAPEY